MVSNSLQRRTYSAREWRRDRINLHMDESEQLYPEQSTTAIVAYHPVARYFGA